MKAQVRLSSSSLSSRRPTAASQSHSQNASSRALSQPKFTQANSLGFKFTSGNKIWNRSSSSSLVHKRTFSNLSTKKESNIHQVSYSWNKSASSLNFPTQLVRFNLLRAPSRSQPLSRRPAKPQNEDATATPSTSSTTTTSSSSSSSSSSTSSTKPSAASASRNKSKLGGIEEDLGLDIEDDNIRERFPKRIEEEKPKPKPIRREHDMDEIAKIPNIQGRIEAYLNALSYHGSQAQQLRDVIAKDMPDSVDSIPMPAEKVPFVAEGNATPKEFQLATIKALRESDLRLSAYHHAFMFHWKQIQRCKEGLEKDHPDLGRQFDQEMNQYKKRLGM